MDQIRNEVREMHQEMLTSPEEKAVNEVMLSETSESRSEIGRKEGLHWVNVD